MPPALGLFSMTIVCPSGFDMDCAMTRATVSVGPGAKGTSNVTGCVGNCCATAVPAASASATALMRAANIVILLGVCLSAHNKRHEQYGRPPFRYGDAALGRYAPRHDGGAARRRRVRRRPDGQPLAGVRGGAVRLRG